MPWLTETVRHAHRLAYHRRLGPFRPPRPLDVVVLVHNSAMTLATFLEALIARTRWPLRIRLCDNASDDPQTMALLAEWDGRRTGEHEVTVVRSAAAGYPEGFNPALENVDGDAVVLSEGRAIVPDLGRICWATAMLQLMFDFSHVGWLNASPDIPLLPGLMPKPRKALRGTRRALVRDTPDTQLSLVRRDVFAEGAARLHLDGIYPERLREEYVSGRTPYVTVSTLWRPGDAPSSAEAGEPRLFIITRTHSRPETFRRCRESIERQTAFTDIVHIVTCEDERDRAYVPSSCLLVPVQANPGVECWYETYVNEALKYVMSPGLVMILDDDDYITNAHFAEVLLKQHAEFDAVFFRTRLDTRRLVPALLPFAAPPYGDIASCGYALRTDVAARAQWEPGHAGDYRYISRLFRLELAGRRRVAWSPAVLTATQCGRSRGQGALPVRNTLTYDDRTFALYVTSSGGETRLIHE